MKWKFSVVYIFTENFCPIPKLTSTNFLNLPTYREGKNWPPQEVASRDFVRHNAVQIAWWWNIPTPFWFCQRTKSSKSLPSQKSSIANFKVNDYSFNRKICKTLICAFYGFYFYLIDLISFSYIFFTGKSWRINFGRIYFFCDRQALYVL